MHKNLFNLATISVYLSFVTLTAIPFAASAPVDRCCIATSRVKNSQGYIFQDYGVLSAEGCEKKASSLPAIARNNGKFEPTMSCDEINRRVLNNQAQAKAKLDAQNNSNKSMLPETEASKLEKIPQHLSNLYKMFERK